MTVPTALRGLVEPGPDLAQRWDDAPLEVRRETARAVLVRVRLGALLSVRAEWRIHRERVPVGERLVLRRTQPVSSAA